MIKHNHEKRKGQRKNSLKFSSALILIQQKLFEYEIPQRRPVIRQK